MNVHTLDHPIALHALGLVRDQDTPSSVFRQSVAELTRQLVHSATADLPTTEAKVTTPLVEATVQRLDAIVAPIAILRSGGAMLESVIDAIPNCRAGHFGVYHDKRVGATVEYYLKLPEDLENSRVLLLDPAIGTGKTALACLDRLAEFGVDDVHFLTFLASSAGIESITSTFPNVHIHTVSADEAVGDAGYLVPGMGDFGDRYYGSK